MGEYKIISVESRKGGVGKTTAALNIGYLLKDRCHVLRITGSGDGSLIRCLLAPLMWRNPVQSYS